MLVLSLSACTLYTLKFDAVKQASEDDSIATGEFPTISDTSVSITSPAVRPANSDMGNNRHSDNSTVRNDRFGDGATASDGKSSSSKPPTLLKFYR